MPTKKKKYNARFPAGRIKKIMQTDEEVGKVAQAVPVIISRTLELFVESLLKKAMEITSAKNAKTLSTSHMKQCILSESRFDFLKDLVKSLPDVANSDGDEGSSPFLSSPTPGSNTTFVDLSGCTRKLPETNAKSEETLSAIPAHATPAQPASVVVPNQMHANFYKETGGVSPSYGQVPVPSECVAGRSSVLQVRPSESSPLAVTATVPAENMMKPQLIESNLLNTTLSGITPVIDSIRNSEANVSALNVQTPLVIPQYINTEINIPLGEDCDTT